MSNATIRRASVRTPQMKRYRSRSRSNPLAQVIAASSSDRTVPLLIVTASLLAALYTALMVTTIVFAAWQTQLVRGIEETRAGILGLENQYYAAIAQIDGTDPSSLGLVTPSRIEYVAAARTSGLSFAGR